MWCLRHDLLTNQDASLEELANLMVADAELRGCIAQRQPFAILLRGAIAVNAAHAT
jgi:hypothetical protein